MDDDTAKISNWALQWKISFNLNSVKKAQEVILKKKKTRKTKKQNPPTLFFSQSLVIQTIPQTHLGIVLDSQLDFKEHVQSTLNKVRKITSFLRKALHCIITSIFITQNFHIIRIRPLYEYGDIIYDQAYNASFHQKCFNAMQH